jgi:DNA modification methylase
MTPTASCLMRTSDLTLHLGDCLEVLRTLPDASVDAVVTDPPYGLAFMGKKWDYDVPSVEVWAECLRVLKPGGHLLAFAGTRTQHRMAVRIEDAGFEIRDMIAWVYGSGFPKSLDVSKAIDKAAGAEREVLGVAGTTGGGRTCMNDAPGGGRSEDYLAGNYNATAPATPEAQQWAGWGTALKPALEPITLARKPLEGTVAANVLAHGTGGLNIDGCRVEHVTVEGGNLALNPHLRAHINGGNGGNIIAHEDERRVVTPHASGRWPANLIHDGSDEVVRLFPQTGVSRGGNSTQINAGTGRYNWNTGEAKAMPDGVDPGYGDSGSAARFFYCAKTSKRERGEGNNHPTVKPIALMSYLCRLVTPPKGTVLDPFMGSGSTGIAAKLEGFTFIGVEREPAYYTIAQSRINA